jgi:purine-binding chemotaxis protein CheW
MANQTTSSYLTFKLGDEIFAAHVSKVLNILEVPKITKVPKSPDYMMGAINLRGNILPVIDTRIKFGMPTTEISTNTCILVLDINIEDEPVQVGAIVDAVQEVLEFDEKVLLPPPSVGSRYKSEFIENVVQNNDEFIMVLNMDLIFSVDELSSITQVGVETEAI